MTSRRAADPSILGPILIGLAACSPPVPEPVELVPVVIHLEDRLESAMITGGEVSDGLAASLAWSFGEGAAGWSAMPNLVPAMTPPEVSAVDGVLRVGLTETTRAPEGQGEILEGGIYVDVTDFDLDDWSQVALELRTTGPVDWVGIGYNLRAKGGEAPDEQWPLVFWGAGAEAGSGEGVRTLSFPVRGQGGPIFGAIEQVAIDFGASGPAEVEVHSITLVPAIAKYATEGIGVRSVASAAHEEFGPTRRTLFTHTPTRIAYDLALPEQARLDLALGSTIAPVRMRVEVELDGESRTLVDETVPPDEAWRQRSIDLSELGGREVALSLIADAAGDAPGLAFWASSTLSGRTPAAEEGQPRRPNVIFYVIDGASAGYMSLYGYEHPTTPNLERIAEEGVVFERAHSNATWTMPSTASFMTSLHHSVLGGLRNDSNPVPPNVTTMAEHFHRAGFHTGVFTFNPNAGSFSGLDRGVDVFRDFGNRDNPMDPIEAISSVVLHGQYWDWREAYPGPHWVHFQTTDVHPPHHPQPPFAGRRIAPEESEALAKRTLGLRFPFNHRSASVHEHWQEQLASRGIEKLPYYRAMQMAHDEAMMHQDARLGELIDELKARGEWENTLFVIGSDHGHPAASYPRFGRGQLDPQPPAWAGALLGEFESHVPLVFFWPGKIEGGRRIEAPVSMIDVLPTVLDLVGLPPAEIAQGQSLAPLLLGDGDWSPRPVVLDEFRVLDDGSLIGNLEVLDERWGESLEIRTREAASPSATGRHPAPAGGRWSALDFPDVPRFQLFDVASDPLALENVAAQNPERAAEAQTRLWTIWREHRELAARFEAGAAVELSDEQLEALQALGYKE